jgi:hypothetical protein
MERATSVGSSRFLHDRARYPEQSAHVLLQSMFRGELIAILHDKEFLNGSTVGRVAITAV